MLNDKTSAFRAGHLIHIYQHLEAFQKTYPDYLSIEIADFNGNAIVSTAHHPHGSGKHTHKDAHKEGINRYIDIIKQGEAVVMQEYLDSKERHLDIALGIKDRSGNIKAVIVSSILLNNTLFPIFNDYTGLGHTGETLLIRLSGDSITYINPTRYPLRKKAVDVSYCKDYFKLCMNAVSGNEGIGEGFDYRERKIIGAYRYIPALGWGLVTKIDIDEAFKEITALRKRIFVLGALILAITLAVSYFVVSMFISPVVSLTQKTKAIASGDYSIRIKSKRKDEIGNLERDFNDMVETLNNTRTEIESKQRELEEVNYELERKVQERTKELSDANAILTQALEDVRKLSYAVEQSPVSIVITDTKGNITYVNRQFCKISGYSFEELMGKNPGILKSGETPPEEYKRLWQTITSGGMWTGVLHNKKKNGELFWESEIISPITNNEGVITNFIGIKEDITEKKRLEEMLFHSQKMEAIGQLAGGIAHDFNNILTAIIGFGGLMQMNIKEDDPNKTHLKEILTAAERATHLTHGLLAFSRKQIINPKAVNINAIIRNMEKLLKRIITEDIALKTALADRDINIMADAGQIEQVLMNLTTNARDAMPHGGILTISAELVRLDDAFIKTHGYGEPREYALISVSDTGMGMDEETKNRIFEPFFTTKDFGKGTGLGLAIVYGIIKRHNGYINCYSEQDKGTTFRIYLPVISSGLAEIGATTAAKPKGGTETVLVADDDTSIRMLIKEVLQGFGYTVIEDADGSEAVSRFAENKDAVRLLLLDVVMPRKNGREAYEEIRAVMPDVKVIFMSGYTADIMHEKGIIEEGINFISKPVSPQAMLKTVREALDR
ncbi:MAG: PAS domain S-box protein [Nitrospirae bacterium]|nr:PAS domain S-box protein [Nitrospirota bacterium]